MMSLLLPAEDVRAACEPMVRSIAALLGAELVRAAEALARDAADGYMDKPQAAAYLKIEERALENWMKQASDSGRGRGLPHVKIGATVRFQKSRIDAWMLSLEVNAPRLKEAA